MFYVYVYFDKHPVYVGKGQKTRCFDHFNLNTRLGYLIRKREQQGIKLDLQIYPCETEEIAFNLERFLINKIGREDQGRGPLFNLTDGGEGQAGLIHTPETKARISKGLIGNKNGLNSKSRTGQTHSPEAKEKISKSLTGKKYPNRKPQLVTEATREKMRIARRARNA